MATAAPEMVSTLLDTVAQAETEGSEVSVEVVGAQEVFSETEYEQLKTLPAQEQMPYPSGEQDAPTQEQ